jgi:transcriptional regulatory protein LevR
LVIPSKIFAQTVYTGEVTSTGGWIRTAPNTSLELPDLGQAPKGAKYTLVKYWGKKAEYKGTIVISDMGQMYLENMLSKLFGQKVVMEPMI